MIEFIEPNVIIKKQGVEKGVPHYYIDQHILQELFSDFKVISVRKIQNVNLDANKNYGYHYFIHEQVNKKETF